MQTDLVDAIEQHETVAEQIAQLVRALPAAGVGGGALKMLFTLATASPARESINFSPARSGDFILRQNPGV